MADNQAQNPDPTGSIDPTLTAQFGAPVFVPDKGVAPYQKYLQDNPQFEHIPKERILGEMHKVMAPDLEYQRFETLAQQPYGYEGIQKAKANLTDVEKFRIQFPEFKDVPRERITDAMYKKAVADKKVDPTLLNADEYRHKVDPLPGSMNDLWNLWEGIKTSSSAEFHRADAFLLGGYQKFLGDFTAKLLDNTSIDIDPQSGKLTFGQAKPGTIAEQKIEKLHDKIGKWIATNYPSYSQIVNKFNELLTNVGLTDTEQDRRAKIDEARSQQWQTPWSQVGGILGQTGTGLALNVPIMGSLQKGFEAASIAEKIAMPLDAALQANAIRKKVAAIAATSYLATDRYKEAVEAHHENAFSEGILGGFSAASLGLLYNTGYGRILTGLNQAIIDAGPTALEDIVNGRPTDNSRYAAQTIMDLSLGAIFSQKERISLRETPHIPLEFAEQGHRPLSSVDVLGTETEGYPNRVSARSSLRVIEKQGRSVNVNLPEPQEQSPPASEDVLARGRPLTRQVPLAGERGTRLISNKLRLNIPDIEQTLQSTEPLEETIASPNVLNIGKEVTARRVIGVRPNLKQQEVVYSGPIQEELLKAVDARENGDLTAAQAHHDTAISLMTEDQAKEHAQKVIEAVKGESKDWHPVPESYDDPEPDEWQAFDEAEGVKRRLANRGESGAIINPAELILSAGRKVHELYDEYWKHYSDSLGRAQAGAIIRRADIESQTGELIRDRMAVHQAISPWSDQSLTRRNRWNAFNNDELKNILIEDSKGNHVAVSNPKKQTWVDYRLYRDKQAVQAAESAMREFHVTPKDWYVRSMVSENQVAKFDQWQRVWIAEHDGNMPTLEDALRAKFRFKSFNPEDWNQAKLNQARNVLDRENTFQLFRGTGRAIPVSEVPEDFKTSLIRHGWEVHSSPSRTKFYVEPETWHVMSRYFDANSVFTIPTLKHYFRFAMMNKSVTGNLLSYNLVHPKHIWEISAAHAFTQMADGAPADKAFRAMAPNPPTDRVLAYMQERIGRYQLTPEDERWYDIYKQTGVGLGINAERKAQLEFGRTLSEFLKRGRTFFHGADRTLTFLGAHVLQNEWYQHLMFGRWIPLMKAQAIRLSVSRLLAEHPEFNQDHNKVEFNRRLAEIGNDIDNRFGERNMSNLLWPRVAKEIGVSHLLSMGWTLGFLNVTGGAVKDYATVPSRMSEIFRDVNDPQRRHVITERMKFFNNYTASYLLTGAVVSMLYGWSRGKKFEPKDLVYPVIAEDPNYPLDDPHHWTRGRAVEFPSELLTLYEHINQAGGLRPSGVFYGTMNFAQNKMNPGLKSLYDALVLQHDFFGQDIGGRPLEDEMQKWHDKIAFILFNNNTPIVVKQQIESRAGHPAPQNFSDFVHNVVSPDIIPAILGYPRAPEHVYRSGFENAVVNAFSYGKNKIRSQEMIEKSNWENEYRLAVENRNKKREDEVLQILEDKYQVKRSVIKQMTKEGLRGESAPMYMFFHGGFTPEEQKKLLEKATPEEKADWLNRATKAERQILASLGVK